MTFGFDLSRYDDAGPDGSDAVADPWAEFVILNIEDPRCSFKAHRAHAIGKPWALYSWLYAGAGAASAIRLQAMVDLLVLDGLPVPPKGGFIDFEANGVSTADAVDARRAAAELATPMGFYTYLYLLNSLPGLADEWAQWSGRWIAYYPSDSPDYFPGQIGSAVFMQAMLWQFTSSGGTRDRNVVVDHAAWAAWGTPAEPAKPNPYLFLMEDDEMHYETDPADRRDIWEFAGGVRKHLSPDEWAIIKVKKLFEAQAYGIPYVEPKPFAGTPATFASTPDVLTLVGGGNGGSGPLAVSGTFVGRAA